MKVVERAMPQREPRDQLARLVWPTCIVAIAVSLLASGAGAVLMPDTARVVHHSSGSTWPKGTSVVAFPAVVLGLVALAFALRLVRQAGGAAAIAACAVFVAAWQVVAFLTAG